MCSEPWRNVSLHCGFCLGAWKIAPFRPSPVGSCCCTDIATRIVRPCLCHQWHPCFHQNFRCLQEQYNQGTKTCWTNVLPGFVCRTVRRGWSGVSVTGSVVGGFGGEEGGFTGRQCIETTTAQGRSFSACHQNRNEVREKFTITEKGEREIPAKP